jgi:hypothetical protein
MKNYYAISNQFVNVVSLRYLNVENIIQINYRYYHVKRYGIKICCKKKKRSTKTILKKQIVMENMIKLKKYRIMNGILRNKLRKCKSDRYGEI